MGKRRYGSIILDLCARRRVVSFMPRPLYPRRKCPGTHWTGDWVGPRAGLDPAERRTISFPWRESNPYLPPRRYTDSVGLEELMKITKLMVAASLPAFQQCSPRNCALARCIAYWQHCGRWNRRLSTANVKDCQWWWSCASCIHLWASQRVFIRYFLMLFSRLLRGLQNERLPKDFSNRITYALLACSILVTSQRIVAPCISLFYKYNTIQYNTIQHSRKTNFSLFKWPSYPSCFIPRARENSSTCINHKVPDYVTL
jgi:hypothetical protein